MKVLSASQIRAADQYTIENEPIRSIDLMERASKAFVAKFLELFPEARVVKIFCGTGNNGGDGLAIGRLLKEDSWEVMPYIAGDPIKGSNDFKENLERAGMYALLREPRDFPEIDESDIVIDGLFGSGLSRPLEGLYRELVEHLNKASCKKVAIDISSGLFADKALPDNAIAVEADHTISFQTPKLVFFQPGASQWVGDWWTVPIELHEWFLNNLETYYELSVSHDLEDLIPERSTFTYKSKVGRLLLVTGSKGKMGAAALCTKAALRTGIGLIEVHTPACGTDILQTLVPEAMVVEDKGKVQITSVGKTEATIGIGPGIGISPVTKKAIHTLIIESVKPLVIDADGINILASDQELLEHLPQDSILTPHPGEFQRLVGDWTDDFDKLDKLRTLCKTHKINVVLKGAYSAVCDKHGNVHFNPSGNPGMATAGSGDVLTGIVASFLAQGLKPFDALRLGVYLHGKAGDLAAEKFGEQSLIASDIVDFIPQALTRIT